MIEVAARLEKNLKIPGWLILNYLRTSKMIDWRNEIREEKN